MLARTKQEFALRVCLHNNDVLNFPTFILFLKKKNMKMILFLAVNSIFL